MPRPKSNYSSREKQEGKTFCAEVYCESDSYDIDIVINRVHNFFNKYYYCLHDKDTYSEEDLYKYQENNNGKSPEWKIGDTKKPHYHFVLVKTSNSELGFIAKQIGIPSNFVQRCGDKRGAVQYLLHLNNPEKHQYEKEELITNDDKVKRLLVRKEDSDEKAEKLFDVILNTEISTMTQLCSYAIEHKCWDELRRGQHIFSQLLLEKRMQKDAY